MTKKIDLDHIAINIKDKMDEACEQFTKLGFTLSPRGFHSLGSINHSMVFNNDYLELIGFPKGGTINRPELVNADNGINGLVFKSSNIYKTFFNLKKEKIHFEKPRSFNRPVKIRNIEKKAEFRTVSINQDIIKAGRVYFCEHLTPNLVWMTNLKKHENTSFGIEKIIMIDDNPDLTAKNILKINKYIHVQKTEDCLNLRFNNTNLSIFKIEKFKLNYKSLIINMNLKNFMFSSISLKVKTLSFFHHLKNKNDSDFLIKIKKRKAQVVLKKFNAIVEFVL